MLPMSNPTAIALQFNDRINARDLDGLVELMTEAHLFVDKTGAKTRGHERVREIWAQFFELFPNYRNTFTQTTSQENTIVMIGSASCYEEALNGPALWKAVIEGERVAEWHVLDDAASNRAKLGVA